MDSLCNQKLITVRFPRSFTALDVEKICYVSIILLFQVLNIAMKKEYSKSRFAGLLLGPFLFVSILLLPSIKGLSQQGHRVAATATLMVVWWILEVIPLAATALLPLALFPFLNILSATQTAQAYGDPNIFLFAGGFFMAMAMQKWNLHERIALHILRVFGLNPDRLVMGFMVATAILSMWISNTATTLMMLPIALAVIQTVKQNSLGMQNDKIGICILLGIAYSASIGGIATLIGTPPNGVLLSLYSEMFPELPQIGFFQWMLIGLPLTIIMLPATWMLLTRVLFRFTPLGIPGIENVIDGRLKQLGEISRGEWSVLIVWILTACAWIFCDDISLGLVTIPGWLNLFPESVEIHNGTIAIFAAIVLFVVPVNLKNSEFALDWEWAQKIPWGILLLFGGGLALAKAFTQTGLVEWLAGSLTLLKGVSPLLVILGIAVSLTFLTELTSNFAMISIMLPILGGALAPVVGIHPLLLMVPATISASFAFMLPVATPPNALIFGSGEITMKEMVRSGFWLNLVGILTATLITWILVPIVFEI